MEAKMDMQLSVEDAPIETPPHKKLSGSMGAVGLALTVLAFSAPLTTVSGYIPFALMFGGVGSPVIFVLTTLVLLLFSVGYVTLNNIVKRPGDFYAFISYGIGKSTGLGSGILAAVSYFLLLAGVTSFFGVSCSDLVHDMTGMAIPCRVISSRFSRITTVDLTSSPDKPTASALWAFAASRMALIGCLIPRLTTR